jgi:hypothetical protein
MANNRKLLFYRLCGAFRLVSLDLASCPLIFSIFMNSFLLFWPLQASLFFYRIFRSGFFFALRFALRTLRFALRALRFALCASLLAIRSPVSGLPSPFFFVENKGVEPLTSRMQI